MKNIKPYITAMRLRTLPQSMAGVSLGLMLAASDEGLDSCWINFFDPDKAHAALGLPDNEEILMFLDLGYSAEKHEAAPKKRKDLSETVSYL